MSAKRKAATISAAAADLPRVAAPARRALAAAGITSLAQLARRTESELLALHGMGPNALAALRAALAANGKKLAR
jgi:predicted Fe-Mo cluster-binding NifX family protein